MKILLRCLLALALVGVLAGVIVGCRQESPNEPAMLTSVVVYTDEYGREHTTIVEVPANPDDSSSSTTTSSASTTTGDNRIASDERDDMNWPHPIG